RLTAGDPLPWLRQRTRELPKCAVDAFAGRYLVICFYASAADARARAALEAMLRNREKFDDVRASFFGISIDPGDETENRVRDHDPGIHFLWDFDRSVSRLCGSVPRGRGRGDTTAVRRFWLIVDPTLHVLEDFPFSDESDAAVFALLDRLSEP